ncbi:thioredoxin family protein [Paludisphaera soli]|uniref:thioredoxin family protein n=1 Tax=Paludisphaera soli TaxID=2712865 RepID=UPI0013EB0087|nr:thioredoxin family protein [Paludisphaera soli]
MGTRGAGSRGGLVSLALLGGVLVAGLASGADGPAGKKSIYDEKADAREQVDKALAEARKDGKRVLLMFGGDWCGWCHRLHKLFEEDREIASVLSNEYALVMIDTQAPNAEGYLKEASKGQEGVGFPFLAVLDADGKLLVGQKTDPLEEGDHHDPKKVKAFLDQWKVAAKDAEAVVKDALARASAEDKRVLLTFGAPWCGWCHRLEDFLARPEIAEALADDLIVAKVDVDRMTHGHEVMMRHRKEVVGGIPWYVVLDGQGKAHGTADTAFGNIGYPIDPKEIDAFVALLEAQKTIEPARIEVVRKGLDSAAAAIKAEMEKRRAERAAIQKAG